MKCVILAAGCGQRMQPITLTRPKVMIPIGNKPILEWNLINAIDAGLKDFLIIIGYKSEMVRNYFKKGEEWNVNIEYINQGSPMGTAHAIGMAEKFVDDFIVLCGDTIFYKNDLKNIIKNQLCIGITNVENAKEYGIIELNGEKILRIYEKMEKPISNTINAGAYHFDRSIFDYISKTVKSSRGEYEITDSINMMLKNNEMNGVNLKKWRDVIYPWHLLDANEEILNKIEEKKLSNIEKNVTIKGIVNIGKNSKILNGTYLEGPIIIGDNCKIGPNCYIRPYTSIGNECHIGNACEIKNSIIMYNSNIPHQNYIGDSVIGQNCNVGAGTKIANLRLDKNNIDVILNGKKINTGRRKLGAIIGDNVQIGINSMINIGSMISNDVLIGPGALIKGELKPNTKIL